MHSKHEGANMKCQPNCAPGGTLSKTRLGELLWRDTGGIHWRILASRSASIGILSGMLGANLLWDTQRDTRRDPLAGCCGGCSAGSSCDPLASYSGILSGILCGIHWQAALAGYSAGSTDELLWRGYSARLLWDTQRDTRRDPPAGCSGGILGEIHWRAALTGYSAGSTGEPL